MSAPPHRLNIQIAPWAKPRSVMGIQSAMTRPSAGKPPAWNMPNRNRSTSRKTNGSAAARGQEHGQGHRGRQQRPAEHEDREDVPPPEPVAQQAARHLEEPIGHQERRHQVADLLVVEAEASLDLRRPDGKADPMDVRHHGQGAREAPGHGTAPGSAGARSPDIPLRARRSARSSCIGRVAQLGS